MFLLKKKFWLLSFKAKLNFINKEIYNYNIINNIGILLIYYSLIIYLLYTNLSNLIPFIYYISSNTIFTLSLSLTIIIINTIFIIYNNNNILFMHFVPSNSPLILLTFNVIIEFTRYLIRIITLRIRLSINISLGHLITTIFSKITLIYLIYELIVILIQSYVFFILNIIYYNETYYDK